MLNSGTRIKGDISPPSVVEIEAIRLGDGTLLATEIEEREDDDEDDEDTSSSSD